MDFGIALAPAADAWKTVQRAEALGFSHAWLYDTQLLCADVFVAMALAAANTRRITIGPGVLVPTNRIAPVAANGLASLSKLAPGRIALGIGTGFTARLTMGLGPMKLSALRDYLHVVRGMLRGETVEWAHEGARRKIRFLNPDAGLIDIASSIPNGPTAVRRSAARWAPQPRAAPRSSASTRTYVPLLHSTRRSSSSPSSRSRTSSRMTTWRGVRSTVSPLRAYA